MYATAAIATGNRPAIVAPRSAVVMRGSLPCAYVLDGNGIAQLRYVTVQIPNDVSVTTTRNYGDTAKAKSDELLEHLLLATLSVTLLVALFLSLIHI